MRIESSCEAMLISSDLLTEFTGESELVLIATIDCGVPIEIPVALEDIDEGVLSVEETELGLEYFTDGIYTFKLRNTDDDFVTEETACVFRDCDTRCKVINATEQIKSHYKIRNFKDFHKITDPLEKEAVFNIMLILQYYNALTLLGSCGECTCERSCVVWCELQKLLGDDACFRC